ncbi:arginine--tRNA ligase [Thalassobacillus devorans]|uniref:arginine--tRNA ligase n=1 Tax=Thalassobacillus devorans TaxID=279813 RepID=UPI0004BB2388|nr:arginine--tRNA ligase [Thalassobacillus devorans]
MYGKKILVTVIEEELKGVLSFEEIAARIEIPKLDTHGDLSFPCFSLAKVYQSPPQKIAHELAEKLAHPLFTQIESAGGYVNIKLKRVQASKEILEKVIGAGLDYGSQQKDGHINIDFSSPNIAKPFAMGHLRSTVIGNSIGLLAEKLGYQVTRINHIGDWGTQFGKLLYAYSKWGDEQAVKQNPIKELFRLYVQFHDEAAKYPQLEEEGRAWFKILETGDPKALKLWQWFRDESLKDFMTIYNRIQVGFDSYHGEAFYNDKMARVVNLLQEKDLLEESEGAMVVRLEEYELPPCLIQKSDGTSLYATRDLAAAIYRKETYDFDTSLYVVGREQTIHFEQIKAVLAKMGYDWAEEIVHVPFGMILKDGKKMSTRKGKVILLQEVLDEIELLVTEQMEAKNPALQDKKAIIQQIGAGAVIFHDLKNHRLHDVEFSLKQMTSFEGETGPYLQYSHVRACSILDKVKENPALLVQGLEDGDSWRVIKQLDAFPSVVEKAYHEKAPSIMADYLLKLAKAFNRLYGKVKVIDHKEYLPVVIGVQTVLKEGLRLLGVKAPAKM